MQEEGKWREGITLKEELNRLQEKLGDQRKLNVERDRKWFSMFGYEKLPWNRHPATKLKTSSKPERETEKVPTPRIVQNTEAMRPLHGVETVPTILLNPSSAIYDVETQRMPAITLPTRQTGSIPPQRPRAEITELETPDEKRIEYRMPGGKLSRMMCNAALFYSCKYETPPSLMLMSPAVYKTVLPFLRTQTAYEDGYPLDESGNITIPYAIDPNLDDYTIACTGQ